MFQKLLKTKKLTKLYKQRILRQLKKQHWLFYRLDLYLIKNKKIAPTTRYFCWVNNLLKNTHSTVNSKKIKNICPYTGRSFVSKRYGMGRFMLHELFSKAKLPNARSY